jgi:flagellar basal body-associated protein FliL
MPIHLQMEFGMMTGKSITEGKDAVHRNPERSLPMSQSLQQTLILVFLVITTLAGMVSCMWMTA